MSDTNKAKGDATNTQQLTLDILNIIKTSQNQHGLRGVSDYQRYRQYCTRRARRIRKTLKFTNGKNKFQKKTIDVDTVTDVKFLLLVLVKTEAAWSYAMQLKDDSADEPAAKQHMYRRLAKAVKWARLLEKLCNAKADKRSILEAEAYSSWISGNNLLEKEEWEEALTQFLKSKTIYDQLGKISDVETQELYRQRVEEIEPSVRYCNYNLKGKKANVNVSDAKGADDQLQSKLESVVAETLKKQADSMREVVYRGKRIPIKNEKLRLSILGAQETSFELDKAETFENKMSVYDKMFILYNDAQNLIKDELAASATGKQKSTKAEMQDEHLHLLRKYITFLKVSRTIERNMLMVESLERRLIGREVKEDSTFDGTKKRSKPDDLVRIYENLIQNMTELSELSGSEDPEGTKENAAKILSYKAIRCFYMGLSYSFANKWSEARALFDRSSDQIKSAKSHHQACKNPSMNDLKKLDEVESMIRGAKCEAHAKGFLESIKAKSDTQKEEPKEEDKENTQTRVLLTRLNDFDLTGVKNQQLASFPPDFEAARCKPVLFDLALGEIEFPSLEARKKPKSGGFWGFWGRG